MTMCMCSCAGKLWLITGKCQLLTLRYLLRQGMAVRGHHEEEGNLTQLLLLRSNEIPQLKVWLKEKKYCSPEIQNEQIPLMGLCFESFVAPLLLMRQLMLVTRNNLWCVLGGWMMILISMKTQLSSSMFHKLMYRLRLLDC